MTGGGLTGGGLTGGCTSTGACEPASASTRAASSPAAVPSFGVCVDGGLTGVSGSIPPSNAFKPPDIGVSLASLLSSPSLLSAPADAAAAAAAAADSPAVIALGCVALTVTAPPSPCATALSSAAAPPPAASPAVVTWAAFAASSMACCSGVNAMFELCSSTFASIAAAATASAASVVRASWTAAAAAGPAVASFMLTPAASALSSTDGRGAFHPGYGMYASPPPPPSSSFPLFSFLPSSSDFSVSANSFALCAASTLSAASCTGPWATYLPVDGISSTPSSGSPKWRAEGSVLVGVTPYGKTLGFMKNILF